MNTLLPVSVMLQAGRKLLRSQIQNELDDRDSEYYKGASEDDALAKVNETQLVAIVARIVGQVDQAWGCEVGLVFYHMDLRETEEKADALYYLIMGCIGHGIGLADDHSKALEKAGRILGIIEPLVFADAPIHCFSAFFDMSIDLIGEAVADK